tara:strand:- start:89 stop:400 length:312 start_codon:yes stop_codon:yes gene_type:complete
MKPFEIAQKYVYGEHDALTDNQEIIDMTKDIEQAIAEQLILSGVVSSKPKPKSLRQIIEERRTNLCLTASILKAGGKNETFFVGKYELLDNILNEFDGIDEPN